jgi:hypothetical protein
VNLVNISEIIFKQGDNVVHTINSNDLPGINANDNTWALANNNTWTSKLTQGEYTVSVKISGNGGSVAGLSSVTVAVDMVKPDQPTFTFEVALILLSSPIPFQTTEMDKPTAFTDTVISCSVLLPARSVATMVTISLSCTVVSANAIQVRQTDAVGNVSDISKNIARIIVDNTNPIVATMVTISLSCTVVCFSV